MGDQTSNKEGLFPRDRPNTEFSLPSVLTAATTTSTDTIMLYQSKKFFGDKNWGYCFAVYLLQ